MRVTLLNLLKLYFNRDRLYIYIIAADLIFAGILIMICMGSSLTADDYQFFSFVNTQNFFYLITHYGSEISGRYSFAITIITSIKLLGIRALEIIPIASLILLMTAAAYALVRYLKLIHRNIPINTRLAVAIALFAVISSLITAPSIFDTFVWFSATPVYITSYGLLFVAISLVLKDIYDDKSRKAFYAIVFILAIVVAGFLEVIPIELVILGFLGLTILLIKNVGFNFNRTKLKIYSVLLILSGVIGGAILRFSPWTSMRISSGKHFSLHEIISITLNHLYVIHDFIFSWNIIFCFVIGAMIYLCIGRVTSRQKQFIIVLLGICLTVLPLLIVGMLAASSGLIEATGLGSNRLLYIETSGIMLGVSLIIYILICFLPHTVNLVRYTVTILFIIVLGLCTVYGVHNLTNVAQATYVKKSMVQYREAVIANDLASNRATIRIMPAGILLSNSQIIDIGFGSPKVQVWAGYLHTYYNIPPSKQLDFAPQAPPGYCTNISNNATYGKQTCEQIVHSADKLEYTTYP